MTITGYLHPGYAESLREFGTPHELPCSEGWILERKIPGLPYSDAMGCYPLFCCFDWDYLYQDLKELTDLASLVVVADPFGAHNEKYLRRCFPDLTRPFKQHYVVDLCIPSEVLVCRHHRTAAQKVFKKVFVEECKKPIQFLDTWVELYGILIRRHLIRGVPAFSRESFELQLQLPGVVAFRAFDEQGDTVGMTLWFVQGEAGYYHLGAYNEKGYSTNASYGLFWFAIQHFRELGLRWLNLGGGGGIKSGHEDGLTWFKKGWANQTRTAYLCGRILDSNKYEKAKLLKGVSTTDYFPAYREGEFKP